MRLAQRLAIATVAGVAATLALACPAQGLAGNGGALVVGDSLEVLTSPYLKQYLSGIPLTVNADGGYNSYQIRELFEESYDPSQSVIVFDAGTNDNPSYPEILAENLSAVSAAIGRRCMVVPTIHGLTVNGVGDEGKNRVVAEFAASRPDTQVPDWARAVATHPELMQADGLHPNPAGAQLRARLIARGIRGCLAFTAGAAHARALQRRPEMAPVHRLAERQALLAHSIALELGRRLAIAAARRAAPLAVLAIGMEMGEGGA